jgi:hypothetical protein
MRRIFLMMAMLIAMMLAVTGSMMAQDVVQRIEGNTIYTDYTYTLGNLSNLDHDYAYVWGVSGSSLGTYDQITSAALYFDNIRDWTTEPNQLYIHLIDDPSSGTTSYLENRTLVNQDYFNSTTWKGIDTEIKTFLNLSASASDQQYQFSAANISTLTTYAAAGNFGIGFDPDCHYYNDGITFKVTTQKSQSTVPEPSSIVLLSLGLVGLAGYGSRRKK